MPRGNLSIAERHQKRVALDTLRMSEIGASIAGGLDHQEAVRILIQKFGYNKAIIINKLKRYGHFPKDIERIVTF
jgi:hypothetical protein